MVTDNILIGHTNLSFYIFFGSQHTPWLDKVLVRHRRAADHVGQSDCRSLNYVCLFLLSSSTLPCGVPALNCLDIHFNAGLYVDILMMTIIIT